jgi:hypothetical protein
MKTSVALLMLFACSATPNNVTAPTQAQQTTSTQPSPQPIKSEPGTIEAKAPLAESLPATSMPKEEKIEAPKEETQRLGTEGTTKRLIKRGYCRCHVFLRARSTQGPKRTRVTTRRSIFTGDRFRHCLGRYGASRALGVSIWCKSSYGLVDPSG